MKIFLATSFSSKLNPDGTVLPVFRTQVEAIIARYEAAGREVFCAIKAEGWKVARNHDATRELHDDFKNLANSDEFVALIDDDVSAGVQMEIGYALASGKHITLVTTGKTALGWTNRALVGFDKVSHLEL
jgi:nucleoside 2-deoxyribosyltransferase